MSTPSASPSPASKRRTPWALAEMKILFEERRERWSTTVRMEERGGRTMWTWRGRGGEEAR
jgi:hypothetical protein